MERQKQEQQGEKQKQDPVEAVLQGLAESCQLLGQFHEYLTEITYASLYDEPDDGEPEQEQERSSPDPDHNR